MSRNIRSTQLFHSLKADWCQRCTSPRWRRDVAKLRRRTPELATLTPQDIVELIDALSGKNETRYVPAQQRNAIGVIIDQAGYDLTAMQISLQAVLASVDCYWWPLKFRDHEPEAALAELMMFAFIELSDTDKVKAERRDPLACVRLNATNRALSSLNTQRRRLAKSDLLPCEVIESSSGAEYLVREAEQTLEQLTREAAATSGQPAASAASFVLHRGFGLSFNDLSQASSQSRATHHRQSRNVERALQAAYS